MLVAFIYHERVKKGKNFVSYQVGNEWRFAPSRFIGYKGNSPESYKKYQGNGGVTDKRLSKLLGERKLDHRKSKFEKFAKKLGIAPEKNDHKFFSKSISLSSDTYDIGPMEIPESTPMIEGAMKKIRVNLFERDPKLRELCVKHWGCKCSVCGFDFSANYGEIGLGFIHVHHLVPLSAVRGAHRVDPIEDLIPVCPNCHAMLHHPKGPDSPPPTVEELKVFMANARKLRQGS